MRSTAIPYVLVSLFALAAACRPADEVPGPPEGEPAGERVESGALGIALVRVPAGFEVARSEGGDLVLERIAEDDAARLSFELGPLGAAGVNLVDRVWEEKARVESLPDGEYRGQNELAGVPLGTTFTSRGRFRNEAGAWVEEYRALLVHPTQNRVLIAAYEYPVPPPGEGQDQNRLEELMLVLEQLEPIVAEGAEPPPEDAVPVALPPTT